LRSSSRRPRVDTGTSGRIARGPLSSYTCGLRQLGAPGDEFLDDPFYEVSRCLPNQPEGASRSASTAHPQSPFALDAWVACERAWSLEPGPRAGGTEGGIDKEVEVASLVRLEDVLHVERLVTASRNGALRSVFG